MKSIRPIAKAGPFTPPTPIFGSSASVTIPLIEVIIDGTPIVDGKWTHWVGTYNETAGEMAFYIDGALVGSVPADYAPIDMST